jgi:hypothetical protein
MITKFKLFENLILKLSKSSDIYYENYTIFNNKIKIGTISVSYDYRNTIANIEHIEIIEKYRNKDFGKNTLLEIVEKIKLHKNIEYFSADCVSKQSLMTFIKTFGNPEYMSNIFHELSLNDALDFLPNYVKYDDEGNFLTGTNEAIFVRYKIKKY